MQKRNIPMHKSGLHLLLLVAAMTVPLQWTYAQGVPAPSGTQAAGAEMRVGDLRISGAFARATLPRAPVAGGYLTVSNSGTTDDRLLRAAATVSAEVQLHASSVEGGIMRMRALSEGIVIPAGQSVELTGAYHIMFVGLKHPLVEGTSFAVTLTFERAGSVGIDMPVAGFAASAPAAPEHGGMTHGTMHAPSMEHGTSGHATAAAHAGAGVDQTGLDDAQAIAALQTAMFDAPDKPLTMGPIIVVETYAVSDWAQAGAGGRALLRKTARGWAIHLCSGEGLRHAESLVKLGVPEAVAAELAERLAAAEAGLPAATIALYDSFDGTMMVDPSLM